MKYLEYAMSLCGTWSCKIHIMLRCLLLKINRLLDSLSGHNYFLMIESSLSEILVSFVKKL